MHFIRPLAAALLTLALTTAAAAQTYYEPARGTAERKALMDTMRPVAESYLGAPVEFVVVDLRVAGDMAMATLSAQRPGGKQIDLSLTPWAKSHYDENGYPGIQALLRRQGTTWTVVDHLFSPTDVWMSDPEICADWAPVLPDICG